MAVEFFDPPFTPSAMSVLETPSTLGELFRYSFDYAKSTAPTGAFGDLQSIEDARREDNLYGNYRRRGPSTFHGMLDDPALIEEQMREISPNAMSKDTATERAKKEFGLDMRFEQEIGEKEFLWRIGKQKQKDAQEIIFRSAPTGVVAGTVAAVGSMAGDALDWMNLGAAVVTPSTGMWRTGVAVGRAAKHAGRFMTGAREGLIGFGALEPVNIWLAKQTGREYQPEEFFMNLMAGSFMGGGFHALGGMVSDSLARGAAKRMTEDRLAASKYYRDGLNLQTYEVGDISAGGLDARYAGTQEWRFGPNTVLSEAMPTDLRESVFSYAHRAAMNGYFPRVERLLDEFGIDVSVHASHRPDYVELGLSRNSHGYLTDIGHPGQAQEMNDYLLARTYRHFNKPSFGPTPGAAAATPGRPWHYKPGDDRIRDMFLTFQMFKDDFPELEGIGIRFVGRKEFNQLSKEIMATGEFERSNTQRAILYDEFANEVVVSDRANLVHLKIETDRILDTKFGKDEGIRLRYRADDQVGQYMHRKAQFASYTGAPPLHNGSPRTGEQVLRSVVNETQASPLFQNEERAVLRTTEVLTKFKETELDLAATESFTELNKQIVRLSATETADPETKRLLKLYNEAAEQLGKEFADETKWAEATQAFAACMGRG